MADSLRVCVFTTAHDATSDRVVHREAVSLAEAGHDVTYYTPFGGDCAVDVVRCGDIPAGDMPSMADRLRAAARLAVTLPRTDYDVYHFHDAEALPVGVLVGALTDARVVYDVHENVADTLRHKPIFPRPLRPFLARAASVTERFLSRFVDEIVAAAPDIAERFPDRDVTVVTNYPRRRWAEETDPATDGGGGHDDGPVTFVYRGLLTERRGVLTLLDAIDAVPDEYDVSLALGGRYGSDADREAIEARLADSDRAEFVEWFPSLGGMIDHFRAADVGTICFHPEPNKTNAVHRSNKLFQYMAAALPVLVSDVGNWATLVEEEEACGVAVDSEDADAVAAAMVELVEDPARRAELGANGHRAALERYNWETQRERLLALYGTFETTARGAPRRVERADGSPE